MELFEEITNPQKRAFLVSLAYSGDFMQAVKQAGVERTTTWYWRRDDKQFSEAFKVAEAIYRDNYINELQQELKKRALEKDQPMSTVALFFALKAEMPDKYREKPPETLLRGDITIKWESMPLYDENLRLEKGIIEGEYNAIQGQRDTKELQSGEDAEGSG